MLHYSVPSPVSFHLPLICLFPALLYPSTCLKFQITVDFSSLLRIAGQIMRILMSLWTCLAHEDFHGHEYTYNLRLTKSSRRGVSPEEELVLRRQFPQCGVDSDSYGDFCSLSKCPTVFLLFWLFLFLFDRAHRSVQMPSLQISNNPLASSSFLWVANVLRDSNCIPGIECSHVLTHFILPIAPRGEDYHF